MAVIAASAALLAPDAASLRRALRTAPEGGRFRDLPVDWHDKRAGTWRPTAIAQSGTRPGRTRIDVFVPIDDGVAMAPAPIEELRLAQGHSDAVTRFWTIRYRIRLLRNLAATLQPPEASVIDAAVQALLGPEAEMRDVWLTAYAHGIPPRPVRTLLRPSDVRIVPDRHGDQAGGAQARPTDAGDLLVRATFLYRSELSRIQGALWTAGLPPGEVQRHPLCATLAGLLRAAAGELVRHDLPGEPVSLDPAVWGS